MMKRLRQRTKNGVGLKTNRPDWKTAATKKNGMLRNSFAHIMSHPGLAQTTDLSTQRFGHGMVPIVFWGTLRCQGQLIALIQMGDWCRKSLQPKSRK